MTLMFFITLIRLHVFKSFLIIYSITPLTYCNKLISIKDECTRYKLFYVVHETYCSKGGGDSSKISDTMFPYKHVWAFWSKAETT